MSLLRFNAVSMRYADTGPVLREVHFRLGRGERVGLIGRNGVGKTTVLRLILGREEPTEGAIEIDPDLRIGIFSQFSELQGERSIAERLDAMFADVREIESELASLEARIESTPSAADLARATARQAELLQRMEQIGGWGAQNRIDTVLSRLGFSDADRARPVDALSGGWRNRAALAEILLQDPDLLLLDEPTNFLDLEGTAWLESWLSRTPCAQIVVSHDRHFLDAVVTRIVEIENLHFQEYAGSFRDYVREKRLRSKQLARQFEHEQELLALEAEAIRDRAEARKNPSRALKRRLANIKKRGTPRLVDRIITDIYDKLRFPEKLCEVRRLAVSRDEQVLLEDASFTLMRGDRLAVLGPNGCGKTSLLHALTGQLSPHSGEVRWPPGIVWSDFDRVLAKLDPDETVVRTAAAAPRAVLTSHDAPRRKAIERFLSLLQFSEMDTKAKVRTLSGGERSRLALAVCLLSGAPVVVLDEPTNHLDVTSTQVMERALVHFPGAVIVVSHDRFFIDKVATRALRFRRDGALELTEGSGSEKRLWFEAVDPEP